MEARSCILIEGLFSHKKGYVRNVFQKPLEARGYKVYSEPWNTKRELKADICIGHSFGAGRLLRDLVECETLITMDARYWDFYNNSKYLRPAISTCSNHYNFYQKIPLRGHPVRSAHNFDLGFCGHTRLPAEVFKKYGEVIL